MASVTYIQLSTVRGGLGWRDIWGPTMELRKLSLDGPDLLAEEGILLELGLEIAFEECSGLVGTGCVILRDLKLLIFDLQLLNPPRVLLGFAK